MNITPTDVEAVLATAPNLNAALKTFLKREGRPENSVEPFVKSLRPVVARNRDGELLRYIEQHYPTKEAHFALLASYAFPTIREPIVASVFEKYADAFNATYERTESGIRLTNPEKFRSKTAKYEFNVDKAIDVLEKAGWKKGADGIRAKDGKKLKFVYQTSINQPRQKI